MTDTFIKHLTSRCKQDPFKLGIVDQDSQLFTRFIYNLSRQIVGYQTYNWLADKKPKNDITGRYWTWLTKTDSYTKTGILGLENIKYGDPLFLVEGQFEQATAVSYGLNCVAVLTNNPKHLRNWLYCYPSTVIALYQNDLPGTKLANLADKKIGLPKDLDEMTKTEVYDMLRVYAREFNLNV
jgi:hypothetical protein